MLKKNKITEIAGQIVKGVNPQKIILFGSYARGNETDESDLDLLIVIENSDLPLYKRSRAIRKCLRGMTDVPRDILVYTQDEIAEWAPVKFSFISNILAYGKTLYENRA
jgi:predicted nucleotidyltransferase